MHTSLQRPAHSGSSCSHAKAPSLPLLSLLSTLLDQTGLARQIFVLGKSKHGYEDLVGEGPWSSCEASQSEQAGLVFLCGHQMAEGLAGCQDWVLWDQQFCEQKSMFTC